MSLRPRGTPHPPAPATRRTAAGGGHGIIPARGAQGREPFPWAILIGTRHFPSYSSVASYFFSFQEIRASSGCWYPAWALSTSKGQNTRLHHRPQTAFCCMATTPPNQTSGASALRQTALCHFSLFYSRLFSHPDSGSPKPRGWRAAVSFLFQSLNEHELRICRAQGWALRTQR